MWGMGVSMVVVVVVGVVVGGKAQRVAFVERSCCGQGGAVQWWGVGDGSNGKFQGWAR